MPSALDDLLHEGLRPLGAVALRRMFGGVGVFVDGLMIGLVADDVLYLKADAQTQARFEAEGLEPFRYARRGGKPIAMSYWRAPERLLDEPDELANWGRQALAVARRARAAKPGGAKEAKPTTTGRRRVKRR